MRASVKFDGLRTRLVLPVLLAAVPATWLVLQTASAWRQHEVSDALSAGIQLTRHAAAVHARTLDHAHRTLATIALAAETVDAHALDRVLGAAVEGSALFANAGVVDGDGRIAGRYRPLDPISERRLRDLVARAGAAGSVSEYAVDPSSRQIAVWLVEPAPHASDQPRRLAFGLLQLTWLSEAINRATLPEGSEITVFDAAARILARDPERAAGTEQHASTPTVIRAALTSAGEGTVEAADTVPRVYAYATLFGRTPPEHLYMSVAISKPVATAAADRTLRATTIALLFACVFAGAIACVSSARMSREVEALVATTARLTDGDVTVRTIGVETTPELARLANSLDTLAATLGDRERANLQRHDELTRQDLRLRAVHDQLEARVHERTAELTAANQALQKLSSAIEQTADSVFITNVDGVIEYVNPAFETMTGFSRHDAIGQTPRLFSSQVHDNKFYETLWSTILSGRVFRTIVTNRASDGRLFSEDQTITPVRDAAGTITHFVSTGRDITERRRTEQALRRLNNELENQAARIAAVLHDEAGQFLASAHITLADVSRELSPEVRCRIQQVRGQLDQAEQQLRLVSHALHPRMLDDLGLTEAVHFLATTFSRRSGVAVHVDVALDGPCPRAVEAVFYRLVQEALTNVGKHANATRVSIRLAREGQRLVCAVCDNGVGFDAGSLDTRHDFSLGLIVIKDRLEAVGGTLRIVSAPQQGTQLHATAPMEA